MKQVNFEIDEQLLKRFKMSIAFNGENQTETINGLIRDYVIRNTAKVNELMLEDWNNKINKE
jgi:hypothetical protein